ncbi:hypothetical protein [Trichoplusia ni ascovirus 2c]|uniref:hypothetical protein n=1 Tax=Trichoplusia ni ascovirus 2c TaxID=328615 RepID=UPI0000E441F2|nr:hypothetical protein TNAV2c_gp026 [Trichoplusia ni ascovirus 2c]ABF70543.1 hypothetical protein [Trichoplusia ni ascovirus 2c]
MYVCNYLYDGQVKSFSQLIFTSHTMQKYFLNLYNVVLVLVVVVTIQPFVCGFEEELFPKNDTPAETLLWTAYKNHYDENDTEDVVNYCSMYDDMLRRCDLSQSHCFEAVATHSCNCDYDSPVVTANFLRDDMLTCDTPCVYDENLKFFTCSGEMCSPPDDYTQLLNETIRNYGQLGAVELLNRYNMLFPKSYRMKELLFKPGSEHVMFPYLNKNNMKIEFLPLAITKNVTHIAGWARGLKTIPLAKDNSKRLIPTLFYGITCFENTYNVIDIENNDNECDKFIQGIVDHVDDNPGYNYAILSAILTYDFGVPSQDVIPSKLIYTVDLFTGSVKQNEIEIQCIINRK